MKLIYPVEYEFIQVYTCVRIYSSTKLVKPVEYNYYIQIN